jgi:hypothetical protein
LSEGNAEVAAAKIGVSPATLRRWRKKPRFVAAYREARRLVVEAAVARLQASSALAVEALARNLNCKSPAAEIRAATTILELSLRGVELDGLIARIEQLERRAKAEEQQ